MISLEQVQILEQKVETAVAKINELMKENDFLRNKFSELKVQSDELQKANAEMTVKLSIYEKNQPRIEQGIMKALERLNNVEDSVLHTGSLAKDTLAVQQSVAEQIPVAVQAQAVTSAYSVHSTPLQAEATPSAAPENRTFAVNQQDSADEADAANKPLDLF